MPLRGDKAARKHTERPKRDTKNKKTAKERRGGSIICDETTDRYKLNFIKVNKKFDFREAKLINMADHH